MSAEYNRDLIADMLDSMVLGDAGGYDRDDIAQQAKLLRDADNPEADAGGGDQLKLDAQIIKEAGDVLSSIADSGVALPSNWRWPLIDELHGISCTMQPTTPPAVTVDDATVMRAAVRFCDLTNVKFKDLSNHAQLLCLRDMRDILTHALEVKS